jgi:hypothetical protein
LAVGLVFIVGKHDETQDALTISLLVMVAFAGAFRSQPLCQVP